MLLQVINIIECRNKLYSILTRAQLSRTLFVPLNKLRGSRRVVPQIKYLSVRKVY